MPQNRLTQGMDLVTQYNAMYPPRAMGGQGVPQEQFQPGPQGPAISPQEAAEREARWMAETGQAIDERGNVVQVGRPQNAPPSGPAFATNPGVIRRHPGPEGLYQGPQGGTAPYPYPSYPAPVPQRPIQATSGFAQVQPAFQPFTSIQSIQSIDLERGIVWADGQAFPFDIRASRQVVDFALGVISSAFAAQLGALLQRYGLTVVPGSVNQGVQAVRAEQDSTSVPSGPEGEGGPAAPVQGVPPGTEPGGENKAEGDSPKAT